MLSTTVSKLAASAVVILVSASGVSGVSKRASINSKPIEIPVALDSTSLLVATLASGEVQTQWMARDACERVASAVAAGENVAGVRSDGVRIYIAQANCSTRRIEVAPEVLTQVSSKSEN